jgi:predicted phage terminase large subunit-like protein
MDFKDLLRARPLIAEHLRKDFGAFCRAAWPHLHAGSKLSWTPAHDLICEYLMLVWQKRLLRLIVNCPPRFAKSSIVTILFPIWCWLQDPTLDFLCCSYEIDLSTGHNMDRKRLMDSAWFRGLFGNFFQLATDRSQAGEFSNTMGGTMMAASVNSKAQGRGGHAIIVDDALSADMAFSETFRNETNSWFTHQLPQRLNDPATSAIILVQQRLHQNDPTGYLLAQEESEWFLLKLALIAEEDETWVFPISGRVWRRPKGACLDPKRWSPRVVKERQRNRLVFASQFQQEPMANEGNIVRLNDIRFFGGRDPRSGALDPPLPESFERKIISVDCSFKSTSGSDYVCVIVVGIVGARRYLIHVTNARLDLDGTENEIRHCHQVFAPISAVLVESTANGPAVIAHLREQIPGVIGIDPQGGKMSRMVAMAPEFMAGDWYLDRTGGWTDKTVEQLCMFPAARHDDISDAISQASIWLQANSHEYGLIGLLKDFWTGKRSMPASVDEMVAIAKPVETRAQGGPPAEAGKPTECPACKTKGTIILGAGAPPGHFWCNQCHAIIDPQGNAVSAAPSSEDCTKSQTGKHIWKSIPGQQLQCDACGKQRWIGQPPNMTGQSRRAHFAPRGSAFPEWDRLRRFL